MSTTPASSLSFKASAEDPFVSIVLCASMFRALVHQGSRLRFEAESPPSTTVEDDPDALEGLKKAGVGQLQPTHNLQKRFASGCLERVKGELGKACGDLVRPCNGLKANLDGFHRGDRDILDRVVASSGAVIVSHANASAIYKRLRNGRLSIVLV